MKLMTCDWCDKDIDSEDEILFYRIFRYHSPCWVKLLEKFPRVIEEAEQPKTFILKEIT